MAGWIFRIPCRWHYSRPARYRSYCYNSKSYPGEKSRLEKEISDEAGFIIVNFRKVEEALVKQKDVNYAT
jgi:hypothetical protein